MANTLITEILRAVSPEPIAFDLLNRLSDAGRPDKRNPGDYLRFETLIDVIQQLIDPELSILNFIQLYTNPNSLHRFLAQRAIAGDLVVTTNFDCLIEEAIRALSFQPLSICTTSDFASWPNIPTDRVPVFKIHGSYKRYDGATDELALETLQATLSSLTIGARELVLPEVKRKFFLDATNRRRIVICGYSGGDDLDIVPTLEFLAPHSLEWIVHTTTRETAHDVTEQLRLTLQNTNEDDLSTRDLFFRRKLLAGAYPLHLYEANTLTYLLGTSAPPSFVPPEFNSSDEKLRLFMQDWEREFLGERYLKETVVGYILFILTRFEAAYERYHKAWSLLDKTAELCEVAEVARMISRVAVEISKFDEAEEWARLSSSLASQATTTKAKSLHQHGYSYYKLGRYKEALTCYEESAEICRTTDFNRFLSYVLHDSALIYSELSQFQKGLASLRTEHRAICQRW